MTVPQESPEQVRLGESDEFIVTEKRAAAVMPALPIPEDQEWFWTTGWQARVAEAEADRLAGHVTLYTSEGEFFAALEDE